MAADRQTQVALGEAWFVAFPASRAAAERWVAEVACQNGWDPAQVRAEALPEIATPQWIRQVLAEVALPDGEERVRELLSWVEEAAVTYGKSARWLTDVAAEAVLFSEKLEQVYPLTGPKLRESLFECAGWERDVVAILVLEGAQLEERRFKHLAVARDRLARYQALVNQEGQA